MSNNDKVWTREELARWAIRHSDAFHSGSREDCEHCQLMIKWHGSMPPVELIRGFRVPRKVEPVKKAYIPDAVRWEVWERDNFTCRHCGIRRHLTVDHIIPESKGGPSDISNYQTLCRRCNSAKWNRDEP